MSNVYKSINLININSHFFTIYLIHCGLWDLSYTLSGIIVINKHGHRLHFYKLYLRSNRNSRKIIKKQKRRFLNKRSFSSTNFRTEMIVFREKSHFLEKPNLFSPKWIQLNIKWKCTISFMYCIVLNTKQLLKFVI